MKFIAFYRIISDQGLSNFITGPSTMSITLTRPPGSANTSLEPLPNPHRPTIAQLRDRAIIGTLDYVRASVLVGLRVKDYYSIGTRRGLRIVRDGIERQCLIGVDLEALIDVYPKASGIADERQSALP